jgi:PTS system nitrogen regulatory IIA component
VSETTVRSWLSDGKIPVYYINDTYRFNRIEIEDWLMKKKGDNSSRSSTPSHLAADRDVSAGSPQGGSKQFSLYRAVNRGGILYDLEGKTKEEVIRNAMDKIAGPLGLDAGVIGDLLLDREALQPTALNNGIAIPHTRDFLLNAHYDVVTIAFLKNPIEYGALDGKRVHTLLFLFSTDDKKHLHLLAKIAHLSSQQNSIEFFQKRPAKEYLLEYIKNWETQVKG